MLMSYVLQGESHHFRITSSLDLDDTDPSTTLTLLWDGAPPVLSLQIEGPDADVYTVRSDAACLASGQPPL